MKDRAYRVRSISVDAVVACVLGGVSLLVLLMAVIASYLFDGNGPAIIGLLGITSVIMSIVGFVFAISAWKSEDGGLLMKRIACILNGLPILFGIVLYIVGLL